MKDQQLYCSIRKRWVAATPEEYVRQNSLQLLIKILEFPLPNIVVEKELKLLPHIPSNIALPDRRADILCYTNHCQSLQPLILIECKSIAISSKEIRQVIGYNHFVKAPFIALVNQTEQRMGWFNSEINDYQFINYIPSYHELIKSLN